MIELFVFSPLETAMRVFLSHLTAALLLVHAAFGCCWHHAHAEERNCHAAPRAAAPTCPGDCHHGDRSGHPHHDGEEGEDSPAAPEPCRHPCDDRPCVFIRMDSASSSRPSCDQAIAPAGDCPSPTNVLADRDARLTVCSPWDDVPGPLRPHLLYQILLI